VPGVADVTDARGVAVAPAGTGGGSTITVGMGAAAGSTTTVVDRAPEAGSEGDVLAACPGFAAGALSETDGGVPAGTWSGSASRHLGAVGAAVAATRGALERRAADGKLGRGRPPAGGVALAAGFGVAGPVASELGAGFGVAGAAASELGVVSRVDKLGAEAAGDTSGRASRSGSAGTSATSR
jgi:hypothetical protein